MPSNIGHDILTIFDVEDDDLDFLADTIATGAAPKDEIKRVWRQRFPVDAHITECASPLTHSHVNNNHPNNEDVTKFTPQMAARIDKSHVAAWQETDKLILQALRQKNEAPKLGHGQHKPGRTSHNQTSHYWSNDGNDGPFIHDAIAQEQPPGRGVLKFAQPAYGAEPRRVPWQASSRQSHPQILQSIINVPAPIQKATAQESPYFAVSPQNRIPSPRRRLPGVVSCIPFPPLSSPRFGIIQETLAHEPCWLLMAITFLIKTSGQLGIPTFYRFRARFPTIEEIADPANAPAIVEMIQHLGLATMRLKYLQRYSRVFQYTPPYANKRYIVRNYDARDVILGEVATDTHAWEIGHLTQGKYALDSWRIFCRDKLLGRAQDWNGKGREGEFQPEWMRVMPADKELRAYLRWMWMREGWEWDPVTGEKKVLRDEMRRAVEEERVEYDDDGGLRILDEPRPDAKAAV